MERATRRIDDSTIELFPDDQIPVTIKADSSEVILYPSYKIFPAFAKLAAVESLTDDVTTYLANAGQIMAAEASKQVRAHKAAGMKLSRKYTYDDFRKIGSMFVMTRKKGVSDSKVWERVIKTYDKTL